MSTIVLNLNLMIRIETLMPKGFSKQVLLSNVVTLIVDLRPRDGMRKVLSHPVRSQELVVVIRW